MLIQKIRSLLGLTTTATTQEESVQVVCENTKTTPCNCEGVCSSEAKELLIKTISQPLSDVEVSEIQEFLKKEEPSITTEEISKFEAKIKEIIKSRKVRRSAYITNDFNKIADAANDLETLHSNGDTEVFEEAVYKLSARLYLLLNS